ncbi:hypothetical protein EE612_005381, partial [Oryza sativa]
MAAKMVLVRAVSLHTVAMAASACGSDCSPAPRSTPTPSTGSSSSPRDALKLRVCANARPRGRRPTASVTALRAQAAKGRRQRPSSLCRVAPAPLLLFPNRQRGKPLFSSLLFPFSSRRRHPPCRRFGRDRRAPALA